MTNPPNLPIIGRPSSLALLLRARRTAAAPSVTWLALPAVVDPSGLQAGFSFERTSMVVPLQMPSSLSTTHPSGRVMGTISALKNPASCAATALATESAEN